MTCAQPKPDFSGEWTLNRQASTLSPGADTAQSGVLRIEHHEPKFTGHQTIVLDGKPMESTFELLSDGREVTATDDRGRRIVSTLRSDAVHIARYCADRPSRLAYAACGPHAQHPGVRRAASQPVGLGACTRVSQMSVTACRQDDRPQRERPRL